MDKLYSLNATLPEPMLAETCISDLFFNYDHPAYQAFKTSGEPSPLKDLSSGHVCTEGEWDAILKDVESFAGTMEGIGFNINKEALATNFFTRL